MSFFQMPFTVKVVRCPKCDQPVYHAEQVLAIGKKWHRTCFRCGEISKNFSLLLIESVRLFSIYRFMQKNAGIHHLG